MHQLAGYNTEFGSPFKQLNRKVNSWCIYTKRIDTYGRGCEHECKYCYAKALLNFRGNWNSKKVSISNILKIKRAINRIKPFDVIRLGGMTDCFQPIENIKRVTYNTILWLN